MIVVRERIADVLIQANRPHVEWLTEAERDELETRRDVGRARQWLAGRWLAKRELAVLTGADLLHINITSRDSFGRAIAPLVFVNGRTWCGSLSISHAGEQVAIAISLASDQRVGVDVVDLRDHDWNDGSLATWFSDDEQSWIRADGKSARRAARLWAVKEATYKATQRGEAFVPRRWPALAELSETKFPGLELMEFDDVVLAAVCRRRNQ